MINPQAPARFPLALALALAAALGAGCAGPNASGPARPLTVVVNEISASERAFLMQAATKSMYELEVSRLAARRGTDPRVRAYAKTLVAHYEQSNNELIALMSAKGVAPPAGLTAKNATKLHKLAALPPSAEFDRGYVRVVGVEDHTAAIAAMETIRRDARDRDLRAWIDKTLPMLRRHLNVAHSLVGTIAA